MVSVNIPEVIYLFYFVCPSFNPAVSSSRDTNIADAIHAIAKSVTLNNHSTPFQKVPFQKLATKWVIVCLC